LGSFLAGGGHPRWVRPPYYQPMDVCPDCLTPEEAAELDRLEREEEPDF
jgi:hypothetical protein